MNLYFFGGSFDPPHRGHLEIIQFCCERCEKLILMPAAHVPLKEQFQLARAQHRIRMLELLIQDLKLPIQIDHWEILQPDPSYTYQTVRYLEEKYPDSILTMVIGADQLLNFHQWKNFKAIMNSVNIIGFNRDECNFTAPPGMNINWLKDFHVDISSTEIRERISRAAMSIDELPPPVLEYIKENCLYGYQ